MSELLVLAIFVFLLLWLLKKKDLGLGLLISSIFLGHFYFNTRQVFTIMLETASRWETIQLMLSLLLVYFFMGIWKGTGRAGLLVRSLENLLENPYVVLVIPSSLIGLIPIVGGALISAPLLEDSTYSDKLTPARKTFLNYWFRHMWEYISPTYAGIIVASTLLKISYGKIFLLNLPLTLSAVAGGIIFGLSGLKLTCKEKKGPEKGMMGDLLLSMLPIISIILFVLVFRIELSLSIAVVIAGIILLYRVSFRQAVGFFRDTFTPSIISLVWGIMCFKNVMDASGVIKQLSGDFIHWGIPGMLLLFILPCIIGLLTGLTVAYVGIAFPLLLGYLTSNHIYFVWAFMGGYFGLLLSPMHYCLSLTKEYFKADWKDIYKLLIWPSLLSLAVAFIYVELYLHIVK